MDDINAAGGLLGERVTLAAEDDAGDPKQAVSVANRLVGQGVRFVVGHQNSGASIPASAVYAEEGVLQVSPASTNPANVENLEASHRCADPRRSRSSWSITAVITAGSMRGWWEVPHCVQVRTQPELPTLVVPPQPEQKVEEECHAVTAEA